MKTILLILFSVTLTCFAQNPTPFICGNGQNLLMSQASIQLGGYAESLGDTCEQTISL